MPKPSNPSYEVVRHRLDNGLRLILQPDRTLPLVAVNLWYHVGSKNERPSTTGLAHLFEHMLFQGSQHVGVNDHFRLVQQAGGTANGSTWFDRTNYYETLPANQLDLGLWLEADRMGFLLPALDEEKLENQRQVVMNERRERIENQPYGRAFERLHELVYPLPHPYHWPVIGYMEDIEGATLDGVASFFETYYAPNNAVLTLAGDFEVSQAIDRVEHFFAEIPAGPPIPAVIDPGLRPPTAGHEVMTDAVELSRIYMATTVPGFGHQDWYAADLLAAVLSSGKSSPLFADLVYGQQIATDVSAFVLPTELQATFAVVATAKPDVDLGDLQRSIEGHLTTMAESGPGVADLRRARNKVITALTDQFQKLDDRADLLSMFTTYFDDPLRIESEPEIYGRLERSELAELASRFLRPDMMTSLAVIPEEKA